MVVVSRRKNGKQIKQWEGSREEVALIEREETEIEREKREKKKQSQLRE